MLLCIWFLPQGGKNYLQNNMLMKWFFILFSVFFSLSTFSQAIPGPTDANAFSDLNKTRNDLNSDIPLLQKQIEDISNSLQTLKYTDEDIQKLKQDTAYFKSQIQKLKNSKGADSLISSYEYTVSYDVSRLQALSRDLDNSKNLANQKDSLSKILVDKKMKLVQTENQIAQLMIPRLSQQNFMFWSSISFVLLMGVLLATFFYVVSRDTTIRQKIFGSDSGIQFITLFSIVIAIIIFGLTGILEGKELSALLGSVAGYILGKVNLSTNNKENAK